MEQWQLDINVPCKKTNKQKKPKQLGCLRINSIERSHKYKIIHTLSYINNTKNKNLRTLWDCVSKSKYNTDIVLSVELLIKM